MSELTEQKAIGRDAIERLQAEMISMPQVELSTVHCFANGIYGRLLTHVPAGTLIVGRVHLKEHLFVLCHGTMQITDGEGAAVNVTGPAMVVSKAGTKRAGLAITDVSCINIERTDETDLDEVEKDLVEPDDTALFDARNQLKVLS